MKHGVNPTQRRPEKSRGAEVSFDEFRICVEIGGPPGGVSVDLWDQAVDDADSIATSEEFISQVRADESRASRDKNPLRHIREIASLE